MAQEMNEVFEDCCKVMQFRKIYYIEDKINCDFSKRSVVYSYLFLGNDEKEIIDEELEIINSETSKKLSLIFDEYHKNPNKYVQSDLPKRNIEWLLKKDEFIDLFRIYDTITDSELEMFNEIFFLHGIGFVESSVEAQELINAIQKEYLDIPFRLYKNFLEKDETSIHSEIKKSIEKKENFLFIVDHQIGDEGMGKAIIDSLSKIEDIGLYGSFMLLSSQNVSNFAIFNEKIYIDYIEKTSPNKNNEIIKALLNSNYSMLIRRIERLKLEAAKKTYIDALRNKNIAGYLASMAKEEGTINYSIISDWLKRNEDYNYNKNINVNDIKSLINLSSILNNLQKENSCGVINLDELKEIQMFEEYDYSINDYYKQISPGDIFKILDEYYVLIGQDCDFTLRINRGAIGRKNKECILLKMEILENSYVPKNKHISGFERVLIGNFEFEEGQVGSVRIDCSKPYYIDDIVLDLCSFNEFGMAEIDLDIVQNQNIKYMVSEYMRLRYNELLRKYSNWNDVKNNFIIEDDYKLLIELLNNGNEKVVDTSKFKIENRVVSYDVMRVCRLKKYISLITKMYSEHRWRMALDTITLDDMEYINTTIVINDVTQKSITTGVQLTSDRSNNAKKEKRKWIISKKDLDEILRENNVDNELINTIECHSDQYYIFDQKAKDLKSNQFKYRKCRNNDDYEVRFTISN